MPRQMPVTCEHGGRRHVVMFSSGAGSAVAAKRVAERHGTAELTLLFADVNGEHGDNYRFLNEAAEWVGGELVVLDNDGKTIWQVFAEQRFLGNSRIDPCSKILKREPMRKWLEAHRDPADTTVHLGFDWTEEHRIDNTRFRITCKNCRKAGVCPQHNLGRCDFCDVHLPERTITEAHEHPWGPWKVEAPLCWEPVIDKHDTLSALTRAGIEPPLLTRMGFPHANCGGGCVKAGIKQFKKLLDVAPETYAWWEWNEERLRTDLGDVAILTDRRGGQRVPFPLRRLRQEVRESQKPSLFDGEDWGGCNCFTPPESEAS